MIQIIKASACINAIMILQSEAVPHSECHSQLAGD